MPNALAAATSPYLLQHADNPVAWQEWNEATLARARSENRPILLSIGYAACHWCHVMAHESFEDAGTAEVMNRLYVNIKVDREERPDLDTVYQQALAVMGQHGGWPLTMFLTPSGEPIWGGTYFPPQSQYGRPAFVDVVTQVHELWRSGDPRVAANCDAITNALRRLAEPQPGTMPTRADAARLARQIVARFDRVHGGLPGAPKFPQAPILRLIWDEAWRSGDSTLVDAVRHTLARICQGGIYDHLGGGFARYSTDSHWLVPHFEKMLYDNAQLLELLVSVHAGTREPLFRRRAEETVAWLTREMMADGAFAASLDADSEGEEGRYYVWEAAEIDRLLGADAQAFRHAYGVTEAGNWEGRNVLNRLHEQSPPEESEAGMLDRCRAKLLDARERRPRPSRDDKILADWNGLMIAALARAAGQLGRPDWLQLAQKAFDAVIAGMGDGDALTHSRRGMRRLALAFPDDYAQMSRAAITLYQQTGDVRYLERAVGWVDHCARQFRDPAGGAFFLGSDGLDGPIVRPKNALDGPSPSANGTLAEVSAMLWHLTGDPRHREASEEILTTFAGEAKTNPAAHATIYLAAGLLQDALQVVVIGDRTTPGSTELWAAAVGAAPPHGILQRVGSGDTLPAGHPAAGKRLLGGRAAAYVCAGAVCEAPITEPAVLRERLLRPGSAV